MGPAQAVLMMETVIRVTEEAIFFAIQAVEAYLSEAVCDTGAEAIAMISDVIETISYGLQGIGGPSGDGQPVEAVGLEAAGTHPAGRLDRGASAAPLWTCAPRRDQPRASRGG